MTPTYLTHDFLLLHALWTDRDTGHGTLTVGLRGVSFLHGT